ncbi:MAG: relaxase domain-containing protein [Sulfurimonas sp.]|nr:relaxase domain-containing protein [Sulfurimonas sp.]
MIVSDYVSVFQASTYYEKDNYYQVQIGEYRGKLKDELQLGDLDHSSFQNLLQGINPTTGESLVASKSGQDKQRAAIDICMKAPKSFSVLVELAAAKNDTKLLNSLMKVWDKSVNITLDHIEKEYSYTRIQKNNKRREVKTGNLLITKFEHSTARPVTDRQTKTVAIDPDIHTHNLLMNFTKSPDGKYRSIEAKKLLNSNLINGQFLRSELAVNLQKDLGINTVVTDAKHGFIEIEGVPHELLDEYSSRHKQIQEKLIELREKFPDMNETKLQKMAARTSRESKKIIDIERDEIRKNNLKRAEKIVNVDELLQKFKQSEQKQQKAQTEEINTVIQNVVKNAEREVKKLPKYRQNIYSVLSSSTVALLGKVPSSEIFLHVKKSEEVRQHQLNTMHEVLIHSLQKTKLDTHKLFESLKNTPKILIEEKFENARARTPSDRDRLIERFSSITNELTRAKHSHNRDAADLTTTTERGEPRAEFERSHDVDARPTARDHKPYVLTIEELRRDDAIAAERLKRKQQSQEYER